MRAYDLIEKKKHGKFLSAEEITYLVNGYTNGSIPDYQMSAFSMAVYFNGMTDAETAYLTDAMASSGDMLDLSCFGTLSADKHSTGGVGDKTTLIVAPIVASLGGKIAKMSGRSLGHTGGTIDKLESIPGYRTSLSEKEFLSISEETGVCVISQTGTLAPADKKLYALRDVTATVDSIPLIASSIMSKKLAAGAKNIALDVKTGSGAFMKTYDDAKSLAEAMVSIGKHCGRNISAVITDMNTPLGRCIGNALEVSEAVEVLSGNGSEDLSVLCSFLAGELLTLVFGGETDEWVNKARNALCDGSALSTFEKWITAQGGKNIVKNPEFLPTAKYSLDVLSPDDGYVYATDTEKIGLATLLLGAGRSKIGDSIDLGAGIVLNAKRGSKIGCGDVIGTVYSNNNECLENAKKTLLEAFSFSENAPEKLPLIYDTVK